MALSIIPATDLIEQLNQDEDFALLSDDDKLQALNAAQEEVCNIYFNNNRDDYKANTLMGGIAPPGSSVLIRKGHGVATVAGTLIVFTEGALPDALYELLPTIGVSYTNPNTHVDSRTANGFTAYSAVDGVPFSFIAVK